MTERPRPPIETKDDREPFKIRGHHIPFFKRLIKNDYGKPIEPGELAQTIRDDYSPDGLLIYMVPKMVKDTVGSSEEDANNYERTLKTVFKTFMQLPSDYPIELSEGRKDAICETCPIIGNHCSMKDLSPFEGTKDFLIHDAAELDIFLHSAKRFGLYDDFTITTEPTTFTDTEPEDSRSILTTAGIVKRIMKKM